MSYLINRIIHKKITFAIVVRKKNQFRKKGVIFVTKKHEYLQLGFLKRGDIIILLQGGHGFQVLKNAEIIEIKQGPYVSIKNDKKMIQ